MPGDPAASVPWPPPSIEVSGYPQVARHYAHVRLKSATPLLAPHRTEQETDMSRECTISVCIRDAKEAFSVRPRFPEHFQYMVLDVQDSEEQNLIRLFPQ